MANSYARRQAPRSQSGYRLVWPAGIVGDCRGVGAWCGRAVALVGHRAAVGRNCGHAVWALMASGQIEMRKIDGWRTLLTKLLDRRIDLAS